MRHFLPILHLAVRNHFFFFLKCNNFGIYYVARQHDKKSVGMRIVMALLIAIVKTSKPALTRVGLTITKQNSLYRQILIRIMWLNEINRISKQKDCKL